MKNIFKFAYSSLIPTSINGIAGDSIWKKSSRVVRLPISTLNPLHALSSAANDVNRVFKLSPFKWLMLSVYSNECRRNALKNKAKEMAKKLWDHNPLLKGNWMKPSTENNKRSPW